MNVLGIIPARYHSTRLEGKPLALINNKPMIQIVYENAQNAKIINKVIVATDDERIANVVKSFGGSVMLTSKECKSGTERVAEAAKNLNADYVVNIQGDTPLISGEIIDAIVSEGVTTGALVSTGCYKIKNLADFYSKNVVKVVRDINNNALFFSRAPIPYCENFQDIIAYKHLGIYLFKKDFLLKYIQLQDTVVSTIESLEQMKILEHGYDIKVKEVYPPCELKSVNTVEDLEMVRSIIIKR